MPDHAIEARIAHDMKAALSPIQTSAYVLRRADALTAAVKADMVAVIERQTQRLARMIDEANDWRKLDGGTATLRAERVDLDLLLASSAADLPGEPVVHVMDAGGSGFVGDAYRLQQMLAALLALACRRDSRQAPLCRVSAGSGTLDVVLTDDGPPCDLTALFGQRLSDPGDEGLGLGLLTAKAIARAHGGDIAASLASEGGLRLHCHVSALPLRG